jgi:hypothetical protein
MATSSCVSSFHPFARILFEKHVHCCISRAFCFRSLHHISHRLKLTMAKLKPNEYAERCFVTRCRGMNPKAEGGKKACFTLRNLFAYLHQKWVFVYREKKSVEIKTTTRVETNFFPSYVIVSNWNFCSMNILHMIAFYRKRGWGEGGESGKWQIHWQNGNTFIDSVTRTFAYFKWHEWI